MKHYGDYISLKNSLKSREYDGNILVVGLLCEQLARTLETLHDGGVKDVAAVNFDIMKDKIAWHLLTEEPFGKPEQLEGNLPETPDS